jgi:hypothetical protein
MPGIDKDNLKVAFFQNVVYRFPVNNGAFHCNVGYPFGFAPISQLCQRTRKGAKLTCFIIFFAFANRDYNVIFVDIKTAAYLYNLIEYYPFHFAQSFLQRSLFIFGWCDFYLMDISYENYENVRT